MPRTGPRGGPLTRARIAEVADGLFRQHGFEAVTVAQIAQHAGVSSVTVFNHFPRKEDIFFDRAPEASELLRATVRDRRAEGLDVLTALQRATRRLLDEQHPLSGADPRSVDFFRIVAASPVLLSRAREVASELQSVLAEELRGDSSFTGDAGMFAALFIAGYAEVMVGTARRVIAGEAPDDLLGEHRARFERLFAALRDGVA